MSTTGKRRRATTRLGGSDSPEITLPPRLCDTLALGIQQDIEEVCYLIPGKLTDRTLE